MKLYNTDGLPEIKAGVAVEKFTPELGLGLAGYFHERIAKSVRDDLYAHALVLQSDSDPVVLITCDMLKAHKDIVDAAKTIIQKETGIPPQNVLIHATHTHTAPVPYRSSELSYSEKFLQELPKRIAAAVPKALANMFDAILVPARETVRDIGSNRLARMKDGSERFTKGDGIGLAGPVDRELQAIRICERSGEQEGETRAIVVNFAMHPDTIGGGTADFYSADWPGEIGKALSAVYGPQLVTLFFNGCCGDLNHGLDHPSRHLPRIPRAVSMGRTLAGATMAAIEQADPMESNQIRAELDTLQIPFLTRDAAYLADLEAAKQAPDATWNKALLLVDKKWSHDGEIAQVPVQVLRIGDMIWVALPGEFFTQWGLDLKHWSPAPFTFVVEQSNGWFGYVPTTDQALRGAYGAKPVLSRQLVAEAGRIIVDHAQTLLYKVWD